MKSKQLANILIKIWGLSVCLNSIPMFVAGIAVGLSSFDDAGRDIKTMHFLSSTVGGGIQAVVGALLVVMSRSIVKLLLKGEDE